MLNTSFFESFLTEGLILQNQDRIFLASGPFKTRSNPHSSNICFYAPYFFSEKDEFIVGENTISTHSEELIPFLKSWEKHFVPVWTPPDFNEFKEQFDDFKSSNNLIKVVPVVFAQSLLIPSPKQKAFLLRNILEKNIGFTYGYWNKNQGLLGVTPEYLFKKTGALVNTMALAGTGVVSDHLMNDSKEVREHQIVVDDLSHQLHDLQLKKSSMYEKNFGPLKHLQTDIQFQTDMNFISLVRKMHPTSALGGSPRENALQWLLKYNHVVDRKRFGAPFAVHLPNGDGLALTAIRNIQWDQKSMILGSGCGLIAKSELEKEWLELKLKREWVIRQLWN